MSYSSYYFSSTERTGYRFTSGSKFFYYSRLIREIKNFCTKGTHLDVGCGEGKFVAFASRFYSSQGMDISKDAIDFAKKTFKPLKFNCNTTDQLLQMYKSDSFEVISAIDVLEHIQDPNKTLEDISVLMKSGGVLLISVPNTHSLGRILKKNKWFALRDKTHVSLLEPNDWVDKLEKNNFKIQFIKTDGLWDSPYVPVVPVYLQHFIFKIFFNIFVYIGFLPKVKGENLLILATKQ